MGDTWLTAAADGSREYYRFMQREPHGVAQTSVSVLVLPLAEFNRILAADPGCYRHFARLTLERY
jgi:hypothetical protein